MFITLLHVKEPTHYSQREGHGRVLGVVVCALWLIMVGWVNATLKTEGKEGDDDYDDSRLLRPNSKNITPLGC